MKPVVAVDIDGTLANYHGHFFSFAEQWLGVAGTGWAMNYDGSVRMADHMDIDDQTYRQIKLAYRQGGLKRMMPIYDHAPEMIKELRGAGAEVWITTTRPYLRLDNVDPDTRFWLDHHRIPYDGLIYDEQKFRVLGDIVGHDRVVCVLDDLPEKVDQAAKFGFAAIQRWTTYNSAVRREPGAATLRSATIMLLRHVRAWSQSHE